MIAAPTAGPPPRIPRAAMDLKDFVSAEDVFEFHERYKSHLLGEVARRAAARLALDQRTVLQALVKRERLGSTGLGHGIAIPHARLDGVRRPPGSSPSSGPRSTSTRSTTGRSTSSSCCSCPTTRRTGC